ncbi:response regulator [Pseudomonas chlororaphis]|uniref:response regulator n=1 Tax=Pseudomonas chlororaphis TaxID=587753 RepID=UPI0015DD7D8F|nr:response regulator [Pseudomonas chlororaphis]QLL13471.1 response regulator [Pseudomonas chlororaphis subsp. aurantiaca]
MLLVSGLKRFWQANLVRRIGITLGCVMIVFWLLSEMIGLHFRYMKGIQDVHTAMRIELQGMVELEEQRNHYDEMRVSLLLHAWSSLRERLSIDQDSVLTAHTVFVPFQDRSLDSDPTALRMAHEIISLFGSGAPEVRSNLFLVLPRQGVVFYQPTITFEDLQRTVKVLEERSRRKEDLDLVWNVLPSGEEGKSMLLVSRGDAAKQVLSGQVFYNEALTMLHENMQVVMRDRSGGVLWSTQDPLSALVLKQLPGGCDQEPARVAGFYVLCMPMRDPLGSITVIYPAEMISRSTVSLLYSTTPWNLLVQVLLMICASLLLKRMLGTPLQRIINVIGAWHPDGQNPMMPESSPDELGLIARFYNKQQRLVLSNQQTLEQQVLERTQELAKAKLKAEKASTRKSEHLANLSHEIRTPLNGVFGPLSLLERSNLPPRHLELVRTARQSSAHLLDIINDMLDFSRIDSGQLVLAYSRAALLPIFDQALLTVSLKAQEKGLKLTAFVAADVPQDAVIDGLRIRQVLVNLLGNAVKFTEQGEIHLRAVMHGERLMVTVTDTGKGIAEECHNMVFQPFVQGSVYDSGTGLGLAIAWSLTQMMDGELSLESREREGASFTLSVPLHDASAPLPMFSGQLPAPLVLQKQLREWGVEVFNGSSNVLGVPELVHLPGQLWQKLSSVLHDKEAMPTDMAMRSAMLCPWSLKVMIIDDVETNRQVLGRMLREMGHVVETVASASKGLKLGRQQVFDLVLMDIRMPEMDGLTATRAWREEHSGVLDPDTPIVAVTANAAQQEHERASEAGMCGYLTKPVGIDELAAMVSEVAVMQVSRGIEMSPNRNLERPLIKMSDEQTRLVAITELMSLHERVVVAWREKEGELLEALHALKGCAGLVGMTLVCEVAEHLENLARDGEPLCEGDLHDLRRLISP